MLSVFVTGSDRSPSGRISSAFRSASSAKRSSHFPKGTASCLFAGKLRLRPRRSRPQAGSSPPRRHFCFSAMSAAARQSLRRQGAGHPAAQRLPLHSRLPIKPLSMSVRARARHSPSQAEYLPRSRPAKGRCRPFRQAAEGCLFRCPKVTQRIPCRAEAVQERIPREQDNEQQSRQQNGEQQLRFSEMSDNRSSDAGQNTCPKQPEHCSKAAYRVTNRGKREENQDAGKQIKERTF